MLWSGVKVLSLVRCNNHENGSCNNRYNTHIKSASECRKKQDAYNNLDLRPDRPSSGSLLNHAFLGSSLACVVSVLLCKHIRSAVASKHDSKVLHEASGAREKLRCVVDEHKTGVDKGGSKYRQNHVAGKLSPGDIIIGKRHDKDVLWVTSHGERRTNVGSGSKGKKVWKRVCNLVANTEINNNSREDQHNRIVHHCSRSDSRHSHDLCRSLPVHRVVKRVTELVKKTTSFHLLKVDSREHKTEQKEKRLHDDNLLSLEERTVICFE
mmetsp:Transcript_25509/g.38217  ORF Transcript_25509/g.38217 Transcript_25509/m.38217 type:complete len:267 (+) Transcript_25509:913-1713(+)